MTSIRRHLLAWMLSTLSLGSLALAAVLYALSLEEMGEVFDVELREVTLTLITHFDSAGEPRVPPAAATHVAEPGLQDLALAAQVWAVDGRRLYAAPPDAGIPFLAAPGYATVGTARGRWRVYTQRSAEHVFQVGQPMEARHAVAADIAIKFLIASAVTVPVLAGLLAYALQRGMQPIVRTSREVGRRSALSLDPITVDRLPEELHPLVGSLNALMAKLSAALSTQRQFTADAAHELRTPLTALRLQVQVLLLTTDERARREAAADIRQGLDRATRLAEQLLNLSRVDPDAVHTAHEPVDLAALVRAVVADFNAPAELRRIDLGAEVAPDVQHDALVLGDAEQLRVLLNNLIDNALRYTPCGGRVDVRLQTGAGDGTLRLEVKDSGPGIAAQERERVFDRFYRGTGAQVAQASSAPGSGLGLAIVRAIADRHGATVQLAEGLDSPLGEPGLSVCVKLHAAGRRPNAATPSPALP